MKHGQIWETDITRPLTRCSSWKPLQLRRVLEHESMSVEGDFCSKVNEFTPCFSGVYVTRALVFCVMFCRSLFVILSFFFWSLWCLSFFFKLFFNDHSHRITVLLSSSYNLYKCKIMIRLVNSSILRIIPNSEYAVKLKFPKWRWDTTYFLHADALWLINCRPD